MSDNPYLSPPSPAERLSFPPPAPPRPLDPGRGLGIAGFVLSFFFLLNIVGLVLSIVGLVQSRRAGNRNGLAVAGIIIAAVGIAVTGLIVALVVPAFVDAAQTCARLGDGVHVVGNATYTCTPTSFYVSTHF
ncbi:DUF4190 domain-containing protein [Leifsonia sp. Le1]|uniref:DUF4190 domain-containing protein n=1 Tax=Leifsonia sp. Le1 TaxID=3404918 RepID=UPI003EB84148